MEGNANLAISNNKDCIGCRRFDSDSMLTFKIDEIPEFIDIFLTTEQAEKLIDYIQKSLEENKKH